MGTHSTGIRKEMSSTSIFVPLVKDEKDPRFSSVKNQPCSFTTEEHSEFARVSRSRWDLWEYLKAKFPKRQ